MNIIVVLSGGGAKGSYQVGVLDALADMGLEDHVVAYTGVSIGSSNSALASQHGMKGMYSIWKDIRLEHGYKKYGKLRSAYRLITKGGMRSLSPFRKLLDKHIEYGRGKPSYAGAANLDTGKYETFKSTDPQYKKGIMASSAMPVFVPPVTIRGMRYWDGGLINVTPLGHALSLAPDALIIITCAPYPVKGKEPVGGGVKGLKLLKRFVDIVLAEGFESDLREFMFRNNLEGYKHVPYVLVSPEESLGDVDDFSRKTFDARFAKGRIDALTRRSEFHDLLNTAGATP